MQKYVLDRNGNVVATFASDYNDKHTKTLQAGASTYEFTISKQDEAALFLETGNYVNFVDDVGKPWSFSILSYTETHNEKTVYCEDVGIELINKNVNAYKADAAYSFAFYFEMITKNTPWTIGINEIGDLSRKLEWTSNDTGLSRLLSLLTEFDNAECKFNIKFAQNKPTEFKVDIYKQIGNPSTNVQIVYSNELNDITKTESRAEFVTAIQGEGGTPTKNADGTDIVTGTNPDGTTIEIPKITFADIVYKDDNYVSAKGDNFLRAVTTNKLFNPNSQDTYIEGYYSYDTESPQELLNRTLTQLKKYSTPQYTYEADVQVIDKNLDLGDTVKIIDHDYKPGLYLEARVASLEKSYTDPSKNTITFTNYKLINSSLAQKLADLQNIINSMPTASGISSIITNVINNSNVIEQKILALQSADGRSTVYYDAKPSNAKEGDTAFVKNPDSGNMEIWNYVGDQWTLTAGDATFDDLKTKIDKAQTDTQTAIDKANSAVSNANKAVEDAGFANDAADQAKTAAANAQAEASSAFTKADSAVASALNAQSDASAAVTQASSASADSKDAKQIAGAVSQSYETLTDGSTMTIAELENGLAVKLTKTDLDGYSTQTWTQNQLSITKNGITESVQNITSDMATQTWTKGQLSVTDGNISASVQKLHDKVTGEISTATTGMATQTWTQGKLNLTAEGFTSQVSKVQTNLDSLSFGYRNLIPNGSFNDGLNGWTVSILPGEASNAISLAGSETLNGNHFIFMDGSNSASTTYVGDIISTKKITLEPSTEYSLRIITRSMVTKNLSFFEEKDKNGNVINDHAFMVNQTDASKYSENIQHFTTSATANYGIFRLRIHPGNQFVAGEIFLAQGNRLPKDWVSAPEDMATVTQFTSIEQTLEGVRSTANDAVTQAQLTLLSDKFTSKIGPIDLTAGTVSSQITQLQDDINSRVQKDNVINQINISPESILIAGQKVHITGQTTIDSGIITNAMISNATIDAAKIKDGTITNAKIANLDGGKITANSITADKLAVNSLLVGLNQNFQHMTLKSGAIEFSANTSATTIMSISQGAINFLNSGGQLSAGGDGAGVQIRGGLSVSGNIYGTNSAGGSQTGADPHLHLESRSIYGDIGLALVNDVGGGIYITNSGAVWVGRTFSYLKQLI